MILHAKGNRQCFVIASILRKISVYCSGFLNIIEREGDTKTTKFKNLKKKIIIIKCSSLFHCNRD